MTQLIFKDITHPEEDKIMGVAYGNYSSNTPIPVDTTSLNKAMIDIHDFFLEIGLTKVESDGSFDPENITFLTDSSEWESFSKTYHSTGGSQYGREFALSHSVFSFNDELQSTIPIVIRIDYVFKSNIVNSSGYGMYGRLIFTPKLTIFMGNTKIVDGLEMVSNILTTQASSSNKFHYILQSIEKSFGFSGNGKLYINIFPQRSVQTGFTDDTKKPNKSAYFSFYLERNNEYVKFINFSYKVSGYSLTGNPVPNNTISSTVDYFSVNSAQLIQSNNFCFIPHHSNIAFKAANNPFCTFKTIDLDPSTSKFFDSTNILVCYTGQISQASNSQTIDVKLANGEMAKYLVYNNTLNNRYFLSKTTSLLLRCDK